VFGYQRSVDDGIQVCLPLCSGGGCMVVKLVLSEWRKLSVFLSALDNVWCGVVCVCVYARARVWEGKLQHVGQQCVVTKFCLFALQQTRTDLWEVSFRGIGWTAYVARFKATKNLHKVIVRSRVLEIMFWINGRILLKLIFSSPSLKLPPRRKWHIRSTGLLRSVDWYWQTFRVTCCFPSWRAKIPARFVVCWVVFFVSVRSSRCVVLNYLIS